MSLPFTRFGLVSYPGLSNTTVIPCAGVCAAYPVLGVPLVALGLGGSVAVGVLHSFLWVLAPLNLVLLWLNFRRHRNPSGLVAGGIGTLLILSALGGHFLGAIPHELIYPGLVFFAVGALIDWWTLRRALARLVLARA